MTPEAVREIFLRHYSNNDLNEALMESSSEILLVILKEHYPRELPEIMYTIVQGRSRIGLFLGIALSKETAVEVPMDYLVHFDFIQKAIIDALKYLQHNYESLDSAFKKKFLKEHLKVVEDEMARVMERSASEPDRRGLSLDKLRIEEQLFSSAIIAICGEELFKKVFEEHNKYIAVLRQCQMECQALGNMVDSKES